MPLFALTVFCSQKEKTSFRVIRLRPSESGFHFLQVPSQCINQSGERSRPLNGGTQKRSQRTTGKPKSIGSFIFSFLCKAALRKEPKADGGQKRIFFFLFFHTQEGHRCQTEFILTIRHGLIPPSLSPAVCPPRYLAAWPTARPACARNPVENAATASLADSLLFRPLFDTTKREN